jgi:hypothetical protein
MKGENIMAKKFRKPSASTVEVANLINVAAVFRLSDGFFEPALLVRNWDVYTSRSNGRVVRLLKSIRVRMTNGERLPHYPKHPIMNELCELIHCWIAQQEAAQQEAAQQYEMFE